MFIPGLLISVAVSAVVVAAPVERGDELTEVLIIGVTPYGDSSQTITHVAGAVQTATAADISRSNAPDLTAFLNRRLGSVHVNENQGNPLQPDVNYRGFTASPLLGTPQGISVYLDGVRLNQPFGDVVSWDLIPRAAIGRMELLSGSSPLFGVNSLGGALSLHSKDGYSAPGSLLHVAYGSHDRRQFEGETGGHAGNGLYWYGTANRFLDDGWRIDSASDAKQLFGKLGWRGEHSDVALTAAGANTDLIGNGLQDFRFLQQDYASVYTKPDITMNRSGLLNLAVRHDLAGSLVLSGNAWYRGIRTSTCNGDVNEAALHDEPGEQGNGLINRTQLSQHNSGATMQLHGEHGLGGIAGQIAAGLVYDESRSHFMQNAQIAWLTPDRSVACVDGPQYADALDAHVDLAGRTRMQSLYLADSLALSPALRLNLAARYDYSRVRAADAITPGGGAGSLDGDHRFHRLNPALGLVWQVASALSVYGGYSQASRAPSAIELGCADPDNPCRLPNAMAGDPPLQQVVTSTREAGVRGGGPALQWTASVFRADSRDDILFVSDEQAGFGFFRNFGKTRRQGVELGATARIAALTLGAQYTWLDATYRSEESLNGEANSSSDAVAPGFEGDIAVHPGDRLPLIPQHILKASAQWQIAPQWSLDLDCTFVGSSPARGNENGGHAADGVYHFGAGDSGGYGLANLGLQWQPSQHVTAYLQVTNLTDRHYSTAAQLGATPFTATGHFVARPFPTPVINGQRALMHTTFLAPGAPRALLLGLRYRFGLGRGVNRA